MKLMACLLVIVSLTGCRSTCCRHTAAKPKTTIELELGYTHSEKSKYQEDCASVKTRWKREI
jgi:hypothetical protein